ncbi:MAG: hypothetical protein ACOXZS_03445 [Bacilli bacterium]
MWNTIKDFFVDLYDSIVTSDYYLWILSGIIIIILVILWLIMRKLSEKKQ